MNRRPLWKVAAALGLVILALGSALLGAWLRSRRVRPPAPRTVVAFLDVGDGDCTLVRTADGATVVVDAGGAGSGARVAHALRRFRVRTIDLLILTSPDPQSVGGVPVLAASFPIRAVWATAQTGQSRAGRRALEEIGRSPRTVYAGDNLQIGAGTFWRVLWPPERGPAAHRDGLILEMDYGQTRLLLAGTASASAEAGLTADRQDTLGCSAGDCGDLILQVPRGGAAGAATAELLRSAAPSVAVLSCSGAPGRPTQTVLRRLQAAGAEIRRTDTMGTVIVLSDGRTAPTVTSEHL